MNGGRSYTTKIWPQPSWIGYWSVGGSSTSMDPRGEPVISNWKRPCSQSQNGSEFPEPVAQNFRNPHREPRFLFSSRSQAPSLFSNLVCNDPQRSTGYPGQWHLKALCKLIRGEGYEIW